MSNYAKVISFIKDLYGNQEFTPLAVPVFVGNEKKYLNECIDTTFVSSVGKFVDRFEEDMARYTGAKRAVVCVSGTNALHMALLLAGVERGDEVLTQALTFIATCNALSYIGARPVKAPWDCRPMPCANGSQRTQRYAISNAITSIRALG